MVEEIVNKYVDYLKRKCGKTTGYVFTENYEYTTLKPFFQIYSSDEITNSFDIALSVYFDTINPQESLSKALDKVGGILYNRKNNLTVKKWDGE